MSKNNTKYTSVGGQAIIEGVMMRGKKDIAIAVRKGSGEIIIKKEAIKVSKVSSIIKLPIIRGVYALFSSMIIGVKALTYSAEVFDDGIEYEKGKVEKWIEKNMGDKADDILIGLSVFMALGLAVLLFMILPTFLINFLKRFISEPLALSGLEGLLKITLFIAYITLISQMKDIRRVFEYHGAEHKVIHCFESGQELTVENAREFTTLHPRCGTSFLLIVMVISIITFSFIGWTSVFMRVGLKLLFLPAVAGVSYEIIRWAGKHDNMLVNIVSYPGLMLQKLTTREPDDAQLEVAIAAVKEVLTEELCEESC